MDSRNFSRKTPHLFDAFYTRKVTFAALRFACRHVLALLGFDFPLASRLCYNQSAVNETWAQQATRPDRQGDPAEEGPNSVLASDGTSLGLEDVSRYCPVCSQRLESRRCKLVCGTCGYYMSCADYY